MISINAVYVGPVAEGEQMLQPLRQITTPLLDLSEQISYCALQASSDNFFAKGAHLYYNKSTELVSLDDRVLEAVISRAGEKPIPETLMVFWPYGGAMSRIDVNATAFRGRNVPLLYSVDLVWDDPADSERYMAWARDYVKSLQPYSAGGLYVNFASDPEAAQAAYGPNPQRLVELKNKVDPNNLFRMNQNIKPTG